MAADRPRSAGGGASAQDVAALERLDAAELRSVVLRQVHENHLLRAQLGREAAASGKLREHSRQCEADAQLLTQRCGELFEHTRLQEDLPPEAWETLQRYRRSPATPRPRRPPPAPPPIARRPLTAPAAPAPRPRVAARLHVTLRIDPGALRGAQWVEALALNLPSGATAGDVEAGLVAEGLRWEPPRPLAWEEAAAREDCRIDAGGSRLLFKGFPLRHGATLASQGVPENGELRLVRSASLPHELRCRRWHEPRAPRGLLMNPGAPAWTPTAARLLPEAFFGGMHPDHGRCVGHLADLAHAKVGRVKREYLDT